MSRAAVLEAAQVLLGEEGLAGLSMRSLARRLSVTPNALYSHVTGKTELLDALCDDLLAGVVAPAADVADPREGVRALMTSSYEVLVGRPDLVLLFLMRQGARGPHAIALGEVLDALLARMGVAGAAVDEARRALIVHVIGFAAFATGADPDRPAAASPNARSFDISLRWLLAGVAGEA